VVGLLILAVEAAYSPFRYPTQPPGSLPAEEFKGWLRYFIASSLSCLCSFILMPFPYCFGLHRKNPLARIGNKALRELIESMLNFEAAKRPSAAEVLAALKDSSIKKAK